MPSKQGDVGLLHDPVAQHLLQAKGVLATQDICSQKRYLKGVVVVVKLALFERMSHVASTGVPRPWIRRPRRGLATVT